MHEHFDVSSRGSTENHKTPRDMLRQRIQMPFGVDRMHARITISARLQGRDTRVRNGAGISTLRRGCRQLHWNGVNAMVLHSVAQRSEKRGEAPSLIARYPLAPPCPVAREGKRNHHHSA